MADTAIRTENLGKIYKGDIEKKPFTALTDLNLEVQKGEVFTFLGPNGAGKTTTIKMLTRLLFPTSGKIWLNGQSLESSETLRHVGFLPEQPTIYGYLTGREFLDFIGRIHQMDASARKKRVDELVEVVGLVGRDGHAIRGYSRGMTQRLGLAQAMMNDPEILILDEPMSNLDPLGRKDVRDIILSLKERGKTIFFSSHILSDAEMIADRIGIIKKGQLIQTGTMNELVDSQAHTTEVTFEIEASKVEKLNLNSEELVTQENRYMISLTDSKKIAELLTSVDQNGGVVISVIPQRQSLEDVFMAHLSDESNSKTTA